MKIERRNGYLRACMPGALAREAWRHDLETLVAAAARDECPRVLLDATGQSPVPTTVERFHLAKEIAHLTRFRTLRIAVLEVCEQDGPARFMETVARNRGARLRVFIDHDVAVEWLCREGR